jgi:hypothetical protein
MPVPASAAHHVLAFCADVPDIGPEADGQAGTDQDQRRGLHPEVLPLVGVEQRRKEDARHRLDTVVADGRLKMIAPVTMVATTAMTGVSHIIIRLGSLRLTSSMRMGSPR